MAEVIKIEIPISVSDQTGAAISSIQSKLTGLGTASNKVRSLLNPSGRTSGLEQSLNRIQHSLDQLNRTHSVEIGAEDNASSIISSVEDSASALGDARVEIGAEDNASSQIGDVEDAASSLDGNTADIELGADDAASGIIGDVTDATDALDGSTATIDIAADDSASGPIHDIEDAVNGLDGASATVDVSADDAASPIFHDVEDELAALDGASATVTILADNQTGLGGSGGGGGSDMGTAMSAISGGAAGMLTSAKGRLFSGIGGLMAAGGVTLGAADAMKTFAGFEAGMSQVAAISGASGSELDALTAKAKQMGATTKFTATESAEAFNYMAMAGWKTEEMLGGIEGIMNLAAASGESLGTTSDIVTDAITAFGLSADDSTHFADVMAAASANANTNVSMLGESFKYVAPLAGAMGFSIEDTATSLGLMANSGVKASMAGTSMRRIITALVAPTDKEAAAMEKYGVSIQNADGTTKSFMEVMENMRDALGGLEDAEQSAAVETMFGKQALSGALAIINASEEDFNKLTSAIDDADGASARMASTMMDNLAGSVTLMQSALEGVKDTFGEGMAPAVRSFVDSITSNLPTLSSLFENFFNGFNDDIEQMKGTTEWKESDLVGKIDIAWDTIIASPLQEWATSEGASSVAGILGGLFESASKLMPGGEEAGLSSWVSGGILALGGLKLGDLATDLYNLGSAAGSFSWGALSTGGMIAVGLGAAAAAILAINTAIDAYNQKEIKNSLEEHFGDISLTNDQTQEIADHVIDATWTVNVETILGEVSGQEQLRSNVETNLQKKEAIEYKAKVKAKVGVDLSTDDIEAYTSNISEFQAGVTQMLESKTYSAHLAVQTFLGNSETGQTLLEGIQNFTISDSIEMSSLSSQLTDAVNEALSDGILSVDETSHIAELQEIMQSILGKWGEYKSKAQMEVLKDKYGNLSGAKLESGTYQQLMEDMGVRRQTRSDELEQTSQSFYETLAAMEGSGRLKEKGLTYEGVAQEWRSAIEYERARENANILDFQTNTLNEAYGLNEEGGWTTEHAGNGEFGREQFDLLWQGNTYGAVSGYAAHGGEIDKGLQSLYDQYYAGQIEDMRESLYGYLDEYGGKQIPAALRDSYNRALEIAAAAGDEAAGTQLFANHIAEQNSDALVEAISSGTYGDDIKNAFLSGDRQALADAMAMGGIEGDLYSQILSQSLIEGIKDGGYGEDLQKALQIALAEGISDEEIGIGSVKASVEEMNFSKASTDAFKTGAQDFVSSLEKSGAEFEITSEGKLHIEIPDEEGAVQTFLDKLGMTEEQIQTLAGDETLTLTPGVEFDLDTSALSSHIEGLTYTGEMTTLDGGSVGIKYKLDEGMTVWEIAGRVAGEGAAESTIADISNQILEANALTGESAAQLEVGSEIIVPMDMTPGETDTSALDEAAQEAVNEENGETSAVEKTTDVNLLADEVNSSELDAAAQGALDGEDGGTTQIEKTVDTKLSPGETDTSALDNVTQELPESDTEEQPMDVPTSLVFSVTNVDNSSLSEGITNALAEQDPVPITVPVDVTFSTGETDESALGNIEQPSVGGGSESVPVTTDTVFEPGNVDLGNVIETAQSELDAAFADPMSPSNSPLVNVSLSKGTDNISEVYDQVGGDIDSIFSNPFSTNAAVNIHLDYNILNPTASISLGGSATGSGTITASVASNAQGSFVDGPILSWVGEDGPEYIIPVGSDKKSRGIDLWEQAGSALGIPGFADGGLVGGNVDGAVGGWTALDPESGITPLVNSGSGDEDSGSEAVPVTVSGEGGGNTSVSISVESPQITIQAGANKEEILAAFREQMVQYTEAACEQIADQLGDIFENRPAV